MALVMVIAALAVGLIVLVLVRPSVIHLKWGKTLALTAFVILPVIALATGFTRQFENAKTNEFCLSCHIMEPYGKSLYVDDQSYVPANHFQNKRISTDEACYDCHGADSFFGDIKVKLRGLNQSLIFYLGRSPDVIVMHEPYSNEACLRCHDGARVFQEHPVHSSMLSELREDAMACIDCHGIAHNVAELASQPMWSAGEAGESQ